MKIRPIVKMFFAGVLLGNACFASPTLTLGWNGINFNALAGYRVYQGLASQNYSSVIDVGKSTNASISGLVPGKTYYFAVTDYETNGTESAYSTELTYTVTNGAVLQVAFAKGRPSILLGTGPAGYKYDVLACQSPTNSANWVVLGNVTVTATNTLQFTDSGSLTNRARFYRLRQTSP